MTKLDEAKAYVLTKLDQFASRRTYRYEITRPRMTERNHGRPEGITLDMVNRAIRALEAEGEVIVVGPITSAYTRIQRVNTGRA